MQSLLARALTKSWLLTLAGFIAASAVLLLESAIYFAFTLILTRPLALLCTAAIAALTAGILALVAWPRRKSARAKEKKSAPLESELAALLAGTLGKSLVGNIQSHGVEAAIAALVAGALMGANPELRRRLRALLDL